MNIKPNKKLFLDLNSYAILKQAFCIRNTVIDVELIEIPPHFRTITVLGTRIKPKFRHYQKLPYTQFYFTNIIGNGDYHYQPLVFISNYDTPCQPIQSPYFSNCCYCIDGCICWGFNRWGKDDNPTTNELINVFWNSTFDYAPGYNTERPAVFLVTNL